MNLKLYGVPLSVHTRKAILALRIKAIPHEIVPVVPVIPGNPPADWRNISPTGLIPAIDDDGFVLADSTAILHYLERRTPRPPLLPTDDRQYATALFLDAWAGGALFREVVHPLFSNQVIRPNILNQSADQGAIDHVRKVAAPDAFAYLESRRPDAFLVGETLGIADLAVVSNLIQLHYLGERIEAARYPRLAAYFDRHIRTPVFAAALADETPYAENMGLDRSFIG